MTSLRRTIEGEIATWGPISFARFMDLALYHPDYGYYARGVQRTGWRGDFVTSPELDPAFGALWAGAFEELWRNCGRPAGFDLIELGPGEGRFAAAVLANADGAFAAALRVTLVERMPSAAARQRAALGDDRRVAWRRSLRDVGLVTAGCVFANEVLDNAPVHLVERRAGELRELRVGIRDGEFMFVESPAGAAIDRYMRDSDMSLPEGHRSEVGLAAVNLARDAGRTVEQGAVVFVDYGDSGPALAARPAGSLLCYSAAGVDDLPLADPGQKDITAHVNWTAIAGALAESGAEVAGPVTQRHVLHRLGLNGVLNDLKTATYAASGAAVIRTLSRRGALATLAAPSGLGALGVLVGSRKTAPPQFVT